MRFHERHLTPADSRNKSQPPINQYEPRRLINQPGNTNGLAIQKPSEVRSTLYRETVIRKQPQLNFSAMDYQLNNENYSFENSVVQGSNRFVSGVKQNFENSFSLKSMRSLRDVDIGNSPSYRRKKEATETYSYLLESIMPTNDFEPGYAIKKDPDFNLVPCKSALINSDGNFKRSQRTFKKKPAVAFNEQPRVVEVESWKLFNIDTAKTKSQVQAETGQKNCIIF